MPSNPYRYLTGLIISFFLTICVSSAHARHLVLVFDVSKGMEQKCSTESDTGLKTAKNMAVRLIKEELAFNPDIQVSIISFSGSVSTILIKSARSLVDLKQYLDQITIKDTESGSVKAGLRAAVELLQADDFSFPGPPKVILYSTEKDIDERGLIPYLSDVGSDGIPVELFLFNGKRSVIEATTSSTQQKLKITSFGCSTAEDLSGLEQNILIQVRLQAAQYLGHKVEDITIHSDLLNDLGSDSYAVYELLATLCSSYEIPLPEDRSMSKVDQIVRYIAHARKNKTRGERESFYKSYEKIVYYATDRNLVGGSDLGEYFGIERSDTTDLSYGICKVSIPESHKTGQLESPFLGLKFLESTEDHFVLTEITPLKKNELYAHLGRIVDPTASDSTAHDILIFIHGFNQSFSMAAKRTAQIAVDLDFRGAPFMYSWPSNNSLFDYWSDREDVNWSIAHLEQLLTDLQNNVPGMGLHLIAHSMGNQALIGALNRIALKMGPIDKPLFQNIILAAPDFDARLFQEQIAANVAKLSSSWSIYASDNDAALTYSSDINDVKRLGLPLPSIQGMDVIDATNVEVTPWSVPEFHSYYATKMVVIRDMANSLKGVHASQRGLIPRENQPFSWLLKLPKKVQQAIKNRGQIDTTKENLNK